MKKKGFLIGMVLSLVMCLCFALFCACSETGTNAGETSKQREVYNAYVAYATAAGDDVLSYEEWLESIRGKDGVDGKDGKDGIDGKDGLDGQNGKDGTNGKDGKSAYDIWKENGHSGTEAEFLEWLKGEKGDTGEQGQKGDDGADGQDGKDGQNGTNGQDGKSAYDIWKENGHSGTESEFLEWLKGEKGENGQNGADGKDGLSAFDIFKKYYPFYEGSEEEWIADLVNGDLTVYEVTFKSEVAEDIVRRVFKGRDLTDIPEVPEKEGQESAKWDRDDFTNITSDIEVHAVYTMKKFTVTFHNEYTEEEDETRTVEYGQAVEDIPTVKEKVGNSGVWDVTDFSRIIDNMTVNAVYETIGLAYTLINDRQEYRVSAGTMSKETEELFIPAVHDEKPVTVIAENAFRGDYSQFKLAHLPESITEIRTFAFAYCKQLQSITIPSNVETIAQGTFVGCYNLTDANLTNVIELESDAFGSCSLLKNVNMPHVTTIGMKLPSDGAFRYCNALTTVEMPLVKLIGANTFNSCSTLKTVKMPNVTSIGHRAFYGCTALEHLEIPSDVTQIENELFGGCTSLKYVILPSGITSIGSDIFKGCSVFESIYFKGDAQKWSALDKSKADEVFNDAKVYYYADPMPEENEGDYWHYDADDKTPVVWKKEN